MTAEVTSNWQTLHAANSNVYEVTTATRKFWSEGARNRIVDDAVIDPKGKICPLQQSCLYDMRVSTSCSARLTKAGATIRTMAAYDAGHTEIGERYVRPLQLSQWLALEYQQALLPLWHMTRSWLDRDSHRFQAWKDLYPCFHKDNNTP